MHVQQPGWGVAVCGLCSVAGLRWLAFLMRVCLRWFPALVSDCLCMSIHHVSLQHILKDVFTGWDRQRGGIQRNAYQGGCALQAFCRYAGVRTVIYRIPQHCITWLVLSCEWLGMDRLVRRLLGQPGWWAGTASFGHTGCIKDNTFKLSRLPCVVVLPRL